MSGSGASFFVVLEGLDGSGKSRVSRLLKQALRQTHGSNVRLTFEPHDPSAAGLFIRQVLTKRLTVPPRTLALAFALNRADHNNRVIAPFLAGDERILLCDRYYLSSLVYQSVPPLTMEQVWTFNEGARHPDLTIFLDASPDTCYERMSKRPEDRELFEENLGRTRRNYLDAIEFLRARGDAIVPINADGPLPAVLDSVLRALAAHGPTWLRIPSPVPAETSEPFSLNGVHSASASVEAMLADLRRQRQRAETDDSEAALRPLVNDALETLSNDRLAALFLGVLERQRYTVRDRLSWTELDAFSLESALPMGITQRGLIVLMPESQGYDQVTRKIQAMFDEFPDLADAQRSADFMFVLDPGPARQTSPVFERDVSGPYLSPSVRIIRRDDLADWLITELSSEPAHDDSPTPDR